MPFQGPIDTEQFGYNPNTNYSGGVPFRQFMAPPPLDSRQQNQPTDYMQQFNEMLAPYQALAARYSSPYAMFSPQNQFAQNHPLLAGAFDRAGLAIAMTPEPRGPEGFGGGLTRAFQGVTGANDFYRQRAMQAAMLPYQMMEPRLKAMDTLAQIGERQSMIPYRQAMEERAMAQSDYYTKRAGAMDNAKAIQGIKVDDKGGAWQEIFDPVAGTSRLYNPETGKHADELTGADQPTFMKEHSRNASGAGLSPGRIIQMQMSDDPNERAAGERAGKLYTTLMGQSAGSQAGSRKAADQPFEDQVSFEKNQHQQYLSSLQKPPTREAFIRDSFDAKLAALDPVNGQAQVDKLYQAHIKNIQELNKPIIQKYNKWYNDSKARKNRIPFDEYDDSGSGASIPPKAASGSPPSDSRKAPVF